MQFRHCQALDYFLRTKIDVLALGIGGERRQPVSYSVLNEDPYVRSTNIFKLS